MLEFEAARKLVEDEINRDWKVSTHFQEHGPLVITRFIEKPYGWIFFYTSQKFWETRDRKYAIAGNGPVIFLRESGSLHRLGTSAAPESVIAQWEAEQDL